MHYHISERRKRLLSLPCTQHLHIRNLSQMHLFLFRYRSTFVMTQRQVQLHCVPFLDAVLAIMLTTQGATIEQSRMSSPVLYSQFQMSVSEPLWSCTFKLGCEKEDRTNGTPLSGSPDRERAFAARACMCKFPVGSAYCSQELVQTR